MHSIKNTVVAVVLLGVTYTVYQNLTLPTGESSDSELIGGLLVEDNPTPGDDNLMPNLDNGATENADRANPFNRLHNDSLPPGNTVSDASQIPSQLLDDDSRDQFVQNEAPPLLKMPSSKVGNADFVADEMQASSPLAQVQPKLGDSSTIFDGNVAPTSTATRTLDAAWPEIESLVHNQNYAAALKALTEFYNSPYHTADAKMLKWLDLLAAKVIYSSEHHLQSAPYVIQSGDKIGDIARRWEVPAQLIYNANKTRIPNPSMLVPGTKLKIIKGPFDAVVEIGSSRRPMSDGKGRKALVVKDGLLLLLLLKLLLLLLVALERRRGE